MFRSNPPMPDFVCFCPCDRSTPHRQGIDRNDTRVFDRCPCTLCGTSTGGHGCHVLTPRRHAHASRPKLCWVCKGHSLWHCPQTNREPRECKGTKRKLDEMGVSPPVSDVHWEAMQEPCEPNVNKRKLDELGISPLTSLVCWEAMNSQT